MIYNDDPVYSLRCTVVSMQKASGRIPILRGTERTLSELDVVHAHSWHLKGSVCVHVCHRPRLPTLCFETQILDPWHAGIIEKSYAIESCVTMSMNQRQRPHIAHGWRTVLKGASHSENQQQTVALNKTQQPHGLHHLDLCFSLCYIYLKQSPSPIWSHAGSTSISVHANSLPIGQCCLQAIS